MRKFLVMAVLGGSLPALGWGPEGHSLVARIAEAQLSAATRAKVLEILGPDASMASVSSWPDQIRRSRPASGPWHFVDIPISQPHLDMARDCPKGDCVVAKIGDFQKVLRDPATPPDQRREALMFLIHFVGDMHQPLHCSDNKDRGGNDVHVIFQGKASNLHSVWDGTLLTGMGTEEQLFPGFSLESAKHARKWSKGTVNDWAEESHKAAQKITYGKLPKAATGAPVALDAKYARAADPLIRKQIEKAGARLARVLNESLQ
jgi:hypothetical protein